ncbi:hypothetical protein RhiirA4_467321 [Rhizophagus irregularis]|uniref:Uncharacterized protein n=1 Tax=Rhizophagus irregularis TaxID=588596 RepID=A0A2I1GVP1_9GLOM|nr:hypothetical protein RhiirA4_467321 [Rhizophagus irregularis]
MSFLDVGHKSAQKFFLVFTDDSSTERNALELCWSEVKLEPVLVQLACMTDMPCKHQGAVSVKFHILTFNFLPSLTSNDRIIYAYIALDWLCCKNNSFYASLYAVTTSQNNTTIEYDVLSCKESNENVKIVDISAFTDFLEEVRRDYRNGGAQLRTALDKFMERYEAAKLKSIPRLTSFIYDLNHDLDSMVNLRSGSMIHKENLDPQNIPSRKTRKAGKKEHNLSKNVLKNQPN